MKTKKQNLTALNNLVKYKKASRPPNGCLDNFNIKAIQTKKNYKSHASNDQKGQNTWNWTRKPYLTRKSDPNLPFILFFNSLLSLILILISD